MSRTLIASFASGVLGAVIGASVVAWRVSPDEVPPAAEKPASADVRAPERADADLERRIAAVERMVTLLETRTRARGTTPEPSVAELNFPAGCDNVFLSKDGTRALSIREATARLLEQAALTADSRETA